ncbi:RNA-binding protein [Nisaea sp.]|uniref:RNA-binding protein n=1 Tax=Nisaea sp. TaxID=2024842 RepID=UPI0032EB14D9
MTRPRQHERPALTEDDDPGRGLRRCIATGESVEPTRMIRFVIGPDDAVVPDLSEKLPGRGLWVTASHAALTEASRKRAFSRAAKQKVAVREDLVEAVEAMLVASAQSLIGLARRAGAAIAGHAKVEDALRHRKAALLIEASDGAVDARERMKRLGDGIPSEALLTRSELGAAFDREQTVHAAILAAGDHSRGLTVRLTREFARLSGFRGDISRLGLENIG